MNETLRELDHRPNDRIDVWLLWREHDNQVLVSVEPTRRPAIVHDRGPRGRAPPRRLQPPVRLRRLARHRDQRRAEAPPRRPRRHRLASREAAVAGAHGAPGRAARACRRPRRSCQDRAPELTRPPPARMNAEVNRGGLGYGTEGHEVGRAAGRSRARGMAGGRPGAGAGLVRHARGGREHRRSTASRTSRTTRSAARSRTSRTRSRGRMDVHVIGQSATGRDMYGVVINRLRTRAGAARLPATGSAVRSLALEQTRRGRSGCSTASATTSRSRSSSRAASTATSTRASTPRST